MSELSNIKITMDIPFSDFNEVKRNQFLDELAELVGCDVSDFKEVAFRAGCTKMYAAIPKEASEILIEMYNWTVSNQHEEDIELYNELLELANKYQIISIVENRTKRKINIAKTSSNSDCEHAVVYVHGWNGGKHSFGDLPKYIEDKTGFKSEIYNYPSGIIEKSHPLIFVARNLSQWIKREVIQNYPKITIIAHSMGGIVARKMIVDQVCSGNPIDKRISHITFIASPYAGVPLTNLAKYVPCIQKAQISELDTNSPLLFELNGRWKAWIRDNPEMKGLTRSIFGTNDNVVSIASASADDEDSVPILNAGHINIVKPKSADDEVVSVIENFYKESGLIS